MAVGYMLLFLLGTCGNVAVLTTIFHVVSIVKSGKPVVPGWYTIPEFGTAWSLYAIMFRYDRVELLWTTR